MSKTIGYIVWNNYGPLAVTELRGHRKMFCTSGEATVFESLSKARGMIKESLETDRFFKHDSDALWDDYKVKRLIVLAPER